MSKDLFRIIMEAEGDLLQPFDDGAAEMSAAPEQPSEDTSSQGPDASGFDEPPPVSDDGGDDLQFSDMDGGEENIGGEDSEADDDGESNKGDEKLSEKANNILNQQLYQRMLNRNSEIEEILNNIQTLVPLLPYDIVKSNDESVNHLKSALNKGQNYVIDKFVNSQYGENLLFFQKLDSLYTLLLDAIDTNLKKIDKSNN